MPEETIKETPKIDDRFASEKAGLPVVKTTEDIVGGIPFHRHDGLDGSPKVVLNNVSNKEDSEGGKFVDSIAPADFNTSSTSYTNVTGASKTFEQTISKRRYLLLFSCGIQQTAANSISKLTFSIDSVDKSDLSFYQKIYDNVGGDDIIPLTIHYITDKLTHGDHTFQVRVKIDSGSVYLYNMLFSTLEITN